MSAEVAVVFHYGNPAEWSFYRPYLAHVPEPFALYATCHRGEENACRAAFRDVGLDPDLLVVPNRGMDTGAFLLTLTCGGLLDAGHRYVLKLHTKSPKSAGPEWRRDLVRAIVGGSERARQCLDLLRSSDKIAMIGAKKWIYGESHRHQVDRYARSIGLPAQPSSRFVAGTMFWARVAPFARFFGSLDACALVEKMPEGKPPYDLSPAHCLERIFGNVVELSGYTIEGV